MRLELQEIDEIYRSIENYIEPSSIDQLIRAAQQDGINFSAKREEAHSKYNHAIQKFQALDSSLSHADVIQGYQEGSLLLRLSLLDNMNQNYDSVYVPLIIQAIEEKHKGADRLLSTLAEHINSNDLIPLLIVALNSGVQRLEEMSLDITSYFKFAEMRPALEKFLDANPEKARVIKGILDDLPGSELPGVNSNTP